MHATGSPLNQGSDPPLHIVLFQPEIPQNTGNIGRTCVALRAKLWIVRPAGFRLDASQLKRAGLDYWKDLDWQAVDNWTQLLELMPAKRLWLLTKFAQRSYHTAQFSHGDALVFGRESSGLPDALRNEYADQQLSIPMPGPIRSLNLATAAGIVMYSAAQQIGLLDACNVPNG